MNLPSKANSLLVSCLSLTLFFSGCGQNDLVTDINTTKSQLASPVFNISSGSFTNAVDISLSCEESGAEIYYTTDLSEPTNVPANRYTTALHLTATTTIKAIAYKDGMLPSAIVSATYIKSETNTLIDNRFKITTSTSGDGTVTLNPAGGSYENGTIVQLTAVPSAGSAFDHWEGDVAGTNNPINVTVNAGKSIKAFFTTLSNSGVATTITGTSVVVPIPLAQGMSGTLTASCTVIANAGVLQSVTVDLSTIGGSSAQVLTTQGNNVYSWTGSVTPPSAGLKKIIFAAVDNTTSVYSATYVPVSGPPAPPTLTNASVNPSSLIQSQPDNITLSCTATDTLKTVTSVVVDLTQVGGSAAQALTKGLNNQWAGTGAVNPTSSGDKVVTFTATNDAGASASTTFTVTVSGANTPPVITSPTATGTPSKGKSGDITISCTVTDPDTGVTGDYIKTVSADLSQLGGPAAQALTKDPDPSNKWQWTGSVTPPTAGTKTITFLATDNRRGTKQATATLDVAAFEVTKPTTTVTDHLNSVEVAWVITGIDLTGKKMRFQVLRTLPSGSAWDITSSINATDTGTQNIDASYLPPGTYTVRGLVFTPGYGAAPETILASGIALGEIIVPVGYMGPYDLSDMAAATTRHFSPIDGTIFQGYNINDGAGFQVAGLGAMNDATGTYGDFLIFSRYGQELSVGNAGSGYLIRGSANINHLPASPASNVSIVDLGKVTGPTSPVSGSILLLPMENLAIPSTNFDTITMTSNKTIFVEFEQIAAREYTLTSSVVGGAGGHGTISAVTSPVSPTGDDKYYINMKVTLTAVPDAGYRVKQWTGTDNTLSGSLTDVVTMNENKTGAEAVSVEFEAIPAPPGAFNLTAGVVGGHGTIMPGNGNYNAATAVTLTATPDDGYEVKAWTGTDDDTAVTATNTVTMSADKAVTVEFKQKAGNLRTLTTYIKGSHGTVNTLGTLSYPTGTIVNLEAVPAAGWRVKEWTGTDRTNATYTYDVTALPDVSGGDGKADLMIGCPDAAPLVLEIDNNTRFTLYVNDPYDQLRTYETGAHMIEPMHVPAKFNMDVRQDTDNWTPSSSLVSTPNVHLPGYTDVAKGRPFFEYGDRVAIGNTKKYYLPGDHLMVRYWDLPDAATVTLSEPKPLLANPAAKDIPALIDPVTASIDHDHTTLTDQVAVFSDANYSAREGSGFATITVYRYGGHVSYRNYAIVVHYATSNGTAIAPADYEAVADGTVTIPAGQMSATFKIKINPDISTITDKTINLTLTSVDTQPREPAAIVGPQGTAVLTLVEGTGAVLVSATASDVVAGQAFTYTVSLDYKPANPVTVTVGSSGYATVSPGVLTFVPDPDPTVQTPPAPQTVTVTGAYAGTDTITNTVTSTDPNFNGISAASVAVTVLPADVPAVAISPSAMPMITGTASSYTVSLAAVPADNETVTVTLTPDAKVSVVPTSVKFTSSDNTVKTIMIRAVASGTGTVTHAVATSATDGTKPVTPKYTTGMAVSAFTATITNALPSNHDAGNIKLSTKISPDNIYVRPTMLMDDNMTVTVLRTGGCKSPASITLTYTNGKQTVTNVVTFNTGEVSKTLTFPYHQIKTVYDWSTEGNRGAFYLITSNEMGLSQNSSQFDLAKVGSPVEDLATPDVPKPVTNAGATPRYLDLRITGSTEAQRSMMGTPSVPGTYFANSTCVIPDVNGDSVPEFAITCKAGAGTNYSNPGRPARSGSGYVTISSANTRVTSIPTEVGRIFWDDTLLLLSTMNSLPFSVSGSRNVTNIIGPTEGCEISGVTTLSRFSPTNDYSNYAAGDFNGDGIPDYVVSSPKVKNAGGDAVGAAYLVLARPVLDQRSYLIDLGNFNSGTIDGWDKTSLEVPVLGVRISGTTDLPIDQNTVCAGNFNGAASVADSISLTGVVFAFPNATVGGKVNCGKIVIMFGQEGLFGNFSIDDIGGQEANLIKGLVIEGENAGDRFGARVCCVGDVNGDGVDDLLVSAPNAGDAASGKTNCGKVYLIYGKAGIVKHDQGNNALTFVDYSGDAINVVSPNPVGDGPLAVLDIVTTLKLGAVFRGEMNDAAIEAISPAGDVNGDRLADFLIGSPNSNVVTPTSTVQQKAGKSYLILGRSYTLPTPTPTPAP